MALLDSNQHFSIFKERMMVGQQFHQYKQSEQPPLSYNHWIQTNTYDVENPGPGLKQTCGEVKSVSGLHICSCLYICISELL
jgi:hypothetical protein